MQAHEQQCQAPNNIISGSWWIMQVATLYPEQISLTYIAQGVMVATWATGEPVTSTLGCAAMMSVPVIARSGQSEY